MPSCKAIESFKKNMFDVERLIQIHKDITGDARGRRYGVAVLNKSSVVLVTATWEAFVEELAKEAFGFLLKRSKTSSAIPAKVRSLAAKPLREHADGTKVWALADRGWRTVLSSHKDALVKRHIGTFNTPKPTNVDALFEGLIGLKHLSANWHWKSMSTHQAKKNLMDYIEDRGAIVHRAQPNKPITKAYARGYRTFSYRLAVESVNSVRLHLHKTVGAYPWYPYRIASTK